jgi:hypothetical protein
VDSGIHPNHGDVSEQEKYGNFVAISLRKIEVIRHETQTIILVS